VRNQSKADVRGQPIGGFSSVKLFTMREFLFQQDDLRLPAENAREIVFWICCCVCRLSGQRRRETGWRNRQNWPRTSIRKQ
jgi:hypothetical protein